MNRVLFLVHRVPFPPDKGDKIRSFNILRHLSRHCRVHLGAFADSSVDEAHRDKLQDYCEEVLLRPVGGWRSLLRAAGSLTRGDALGLGYYRDSKMSDWTENLIRSGKVDCVFAFSSTMAQYGSTASAAGIPFFVDFVDVDSDKWRQYARDKPFPFSQLYRYEAKQLAKWERKVADFANGVSVVSNAERSLLREVLAGQDALVEVIRNGVDIDFFDPNIAFENPYSPDTKVVVFTGAMDYFANENAVIWFAREVWKNIYRKVDGIQFHIVGSNPTAAVKSLSSEPGITVVGGVPDIRPYLKYASVAVAPLRIARGVQNKVLEALAMNLPVIAAPQAMQGLDENFPDSIIVATSPRDFSDAILEMLAGETGAPSSSGRNFVKKYYNWDENLAAITRLLECGAMSTAPHSIDSCDTQ